MEVALDPNLKEGFLGNHATLWDKRHGLEIFTACIMYRKYGTKYNQRLLLYLGTINY